MQSIYLLLGHFSWSSQYFVCIYNSRWWISIINFINRSFLECGLNSKSLCSLSRTGTPCFRGYGRRNGERRRKSVRGCIVSHDLSVLNLIIVKKGENDLPGLTDTEKPRMRGPKRASKIRKLFNLSKEDDVRKYVNTYRRTFTTKSGIAACLMFSVLL